MQNLKLKRFEKCLPMISLQHLEHAECQISDHHVILLTQYGMRGWNDCCSKVKKLEIVFLFESKFLNL